MKDGSPKKEIAFLAQDKLCKFKRKKKKIAL